MSSSSSSSSAEDRATDERKAKDEKLAVFRDANDKNTPFKMTKTERERMIHQKFPSVDTLNWDNAFHNDLDLFARIMRDIIKLDQREPGKSGPRPNNMDYDRGVASFRQLMGQDYSTLPFHEAFSILARERSLTQLARKSHISRSRLGRLKLGQELPTQEDMKAIASAFGKNPAYFVEYRRAFIIEQLSNRLLSAPEITITYYTKILKAE